MNRLNNDWYYDLPDEPDDERYPITRFFNDRLGIYFNLKGKKQKYKTLNLTLFNLLDITFSLTGNSHKRFYFTHRFPAWFYRGTLNKPYCFHLYLSYVGGGYHYDCVSEEFGNAIELSLYALPTWDKDLYYGFDSPWKYKSLIDWKWFKAEKKRNNS